MGANEKHDTTYHGREYTPTTDRLQAAAVDGALITKPEFDRWLETVRAEAKQEALEQLAETYRALPNFQTVLLTRAARMRDRANQYKEEQ